MFYTKEANKTTKKKGNCTINMKKIFALLLVFVMVLGMTACSTNKSLTINVDTGDEIKVTCDTSEDISMHWDGDDSEMTIKEDDEEIFGFFFIGEDGFEDEMEDLNGEIIIKEDDEENGLRYIILTMPDEDDAYGLVAWIVGSDTGICGAAESKKDITKALNALTFTVEDTDQDDDDFYPEILDEMVEWTETPDEPDEPENPEIPDEPEQPDTTEPETPDVTEPEKPTEPETPAETEPAKPVEGMSDNWKDFTISYDGKVMKMPISYKEFKEITGLTMKSAEEKSYLEPNDYTVVTLRNAEGDGVCAVSVLNTTDEDATYADCTIIELSQYDSHLDNGHAFVFSGVKIGDVTSKDELLAKWGEPTKVYEYRIDEDDDQSWKKYESDTYTWSMDKDWTTRDNIEIKMNINTGIIEEISMEFSGLID